MAPLLPPGPPPAPAPAPAAAPAPSGIVSFGVKPATPHPSQKSLAARADAVSDPHVYPFTGKYRWGGHSYELTLDIPCKDWKNKNTVEIEQAAKLYADLFFADLMQNLDSKKGEEAIRPGESFEILFKGEDDGYIAFVPEKGVNPLTLEDKDFDSLKKVVRAKSPASKCLSKTIELEDPKKIISRLKEEPSLASLREGLQKSQSEKEIPPLNLEQTKNCCFLAAAFQQLIHDPLLKEALSDPNNYRVGKSSGLYKAIRDYFQNASGSKERISLSNYFQSDEISKASDITDGFKVLKSYFVKEEEGLAESLQKFFDTCAIAYHQEGQEQTIGQLVERQIPLKTLPKVLSLDIAPSLKHLKQALSAYLDDKAKESFLKNLKENLEDTEEQALKIALGGEESFDKTVETFKNRESFEPFQKTYNSLEGETRAQQALCHLYFFHALESGNLLETDLFKDPNFTKYAIEAVSQKKDMTRLIQSQVLQDLQIDPSGEIFIDSADRKQTSQYEITSFSLYSNQHYISYVHKDGKYWKLNTLDKNPVSLTKEQYLEEAKRGSFFVLHSVSSASGRNLGKNTPLHSTPLGSGSTTLLLEEGRIGVKEHAPFTTINPHTPQRPLHEQLEDRTDAAQIKGQIKTGKLSPRKERSFFPSSSPQLLVSSTSPDVLHLPLGPSFGLKQLEKAVEDALKFAEKNKKTHLIFPVLPCQDATEQEILTAMGRAIQEFFKENQSSEIQEIRIVKPKKPFAAGA